ncbi:MAG: polysaccharide deacetylase family protein [Bacilli bacterium]|nr:polysaccharide deacetylase family protein [Bacilli bacterium]
MNLNIIKFVNIDTTNIVKNNSFTHIKNKPIEDNIDNKRKHGIPTLPIIIDTKEKEIKFIPEEIEIKEVETIEMEDEKLISLTFDDGPSEYTNRLVNILKKNNSNATFFISGKDIKGNEDIIKNIKDNGNEIGINGFSKKSFTDMSVDEVEAEIAGTYNMLSKLDVNPSNIVRPPLGKLNETIKVQVRSPFVLWNVDAGEPNKSNNVQMKNNIINNIEPGSIIRMHDSSIKTLQVLDELLPTLIEAGYKFVTLDEMNKKYSNVFVPGKVYAKIRGYAA